MALASSATLIGSYHKRYGINRQDYANASNGKLSVVVGADGCGSGDVVRDDGGDWDLPSQSELGAGIATAFLVRYVDRLFDVLGIDTLNEQSVQLIVNSTWNRLQRLYDSLIREVAGLNPDSDFAKYSLLSTITVALEFEGHLILMSSGDGLCAVYKGNSEPEILHIDQNNAPHYPAYYAFAMEAHGDNAWDIVRWYKPHEWDKFVAVSDGGIVDGGLHPALSHENLFYGANVSPHVLQHTINMLHDDGLLVPSDDLYVVALEK